MTIWNLGSINIDHVYRVPHLPSAGETLAARSLTKGLGGKGANMSVAAARAAARVCHIGAVGSDGRWAAERLLQYGVDTRHIQVVDEPTGHAIITVGEDAENQIVLFAGANGVIAPEAIDAALIEASVGDLFLTQNETSGQLEAIRRAAELGLRVAYAAAPFEPEAVAVVLPYLDLLFLNEVEARQLEEATGQLIADLPVADIVVTRGAQGATHFDTRKGARTDHSAHKVAAVDTTGAGDTFTGYVLASLDRGLPMGQAMDQAMRAAALMVTRAGAADVIPDLREVQDMIGG